MASYFIFGAVGTSPSCGDHRFSGPPVLTTNSSVACHKCGQTCSVEDAIETAIDADSVKKLSDHRVVQGG
jgi:uncharacterized Zn-binding protein involved in type VI secretion